MSYGYRIRFSTYSFSFRSSYKTHSSQTNDRCTTCQLPLCLSCSCRKTVVRTELTQFYAVTRMHRNCRHFRKFARLSCCQFLAPLCRRTVKPQTVLAIRTVIRDDRDCDSARVSSKRRPAAVHRPSLKISYFTPITQKAQGKAFLKTWMLALYEPPRGKTNNVVSEQVRHKPACTSTEKS